ncbi:uncharacterized protein LOC123713666 isoform X2 [Pieris brassicae]|uniref:uncharacterized protein LOC123713666 isoform X2 n=1 Tax=Pieris brassicae TaxID=7116 RepID=UPI001E66163D|nr:uncharacterized protein LOC123713666 isoform X2 [Pieris brassicae]
MSSICFLYTVVIFTVIYNVLCEIDKQKRQNVEELEVWTDQRFASRRYAQNRRFKEIHLRTTTPMKKKYENVKKVKRKAQKGSKLGEFRAPSQHTNFTSRKATNVSKSQKGVFRSHSKWTLMNVSWPKVAPQLRAKPLSTRITQMMLQEEPEISRYKLLDDEIGSEYLSPYAIKQQISRISSKFPNTNITIDVIGRTVEYNDIVLMRISEMNDLQRHFRAEDDKYADEAPQKKIVFIVHGLTVMGISSIRCLSHDKEFTKLLSYYLTHLDNFDIFLIPLANPDGFTVSQHKNIWNKNVSPQNACPGVNVDRNFDVAWNSSNIISSCSQQYPGTSPFSEAESRAIRDVFHKYGHKIVAYMHVHAGSFEPSIYKGEAVLYPRGFSEAQSDDDKYIDLKGEIDEVMRNASFKTVSVSVDTLHNWYGRIFGSSVDYASTIYGIPFSLELVMQLYDIYVYDTGEHYEESALSEIWKRVIDVIFTNIWKHIHEPDP